MKIYKKSMIIIIGVLFLIAGMVQSVADVIYGDDEIDNNVQLIHIKDMNNQAVMVDGGYIMSYDQPPISSDDTWDLLTSELNANGNTYKMYDNFWDASGRIDKITWWGICGFYDNGWHVGDPDKMRFSIEFYDDSSHSLIIPPTDLISTCEVQYDDLQITHTGLFYQDDSGSFELIQFEYEMLSTIHLSDGEGWISIQSHDDVDGDWFLWINSNSGDDFSYQQGGDLDINLDMSFRFYVKDWIPPQITIEKPAQSTIYISGNEIAQCPFLTIIIGPIAINVNVTDDWTDVDYVELFINDETKAPLHNEPYRWIWTEPSNIFGKYTIKIKAFDTVGNYAIEEMNVFKLF